MKKKGIKSKTTTTTIIIIRMTLMILEKQLLPIMFEAASVT